MTQDIHLLRVAQDLGLEYVEVERRKDEPEIKRLRAIAKQLKAIDEYQQGLVAEVQAHAPKPIAGFDPVLDSIDHLFEYDGGK